MSRSKPRLLIVANRFYPQVGGAEITSFLQAQELSHHFDVDVFTPQRDHDPRFEQCHGLRIQRDPSWSNRERKFPDLSAKALCPRIFPKVLAGSYDVIHCYPAMNYNNMLAVLGARVRRTPIFLSNFDLFDYGQILKSKSEDITALKSLSLAKKQKLFLKQFHGIFTISRKETEMIQAVNAHTELSTVPVQLDEFDRSVDLDAFVQKFGLKRGVPTLLCLSRVCQLKGQDRLIHALPRLREKLPNFQVLLVGRTDYETEFFGQLRSFVRAHNLEEQVIFTGEVSRDEALAALKLCDASVFPMRFMNSGMVVVESWAAGKPVVNSDGIDPNYVEEGVNGFTFSGESTEHLVERIVEVLQDPKKAQRMGAAGRALVEEKFLYPHLIQQYLRAYARAGVDIASR